jgi:hypothetical protein
MERATVAPGRDLRIGLSCLLSRLISENRDESVERAILLDDRVKASLNHHRCR